MLSISVSHGLVVYGFKQIYLYKIKKKVDTINRFLGICVLSLIFVGYYILCATTEGKVFYLDSRGLTIKRCLHLNKDMIRYVNSTKDLKILVYSSIYKSFLLDFKRKRIILVFKLPIIAGVFLEQKKNFAFITVGCVLYILKDYASLIKILDVSFGGQIFKSSCSNYLVIRYKRRKFQLINPETKETEEGSKLRFLLQGKLKYSKNSIIVSCLNYIGLINL